MSEQDFFFDEDDDVQEAPKTSDSSKPKAPAKNATAKSAPAKSAPSKGGSTRTPAVADAAPAPFLEQNVTMMVAIMMLVIGMLVGFILGFLIAPSGTATPVSNQNIEAPASGTPGSLTQEQLNGGLPAGHPNIGGGETATGTTTATP